MNGETELKDSKKRIRITNSLAGEPWAIRDGLSMANNLGGESYSCGIRRSRSNDIIDF